LLIEDVFVVVRGVQALVDEQGLLLREDTELVEGFYLEIQLDVENLSLVAQADCVKTFHRIYFGLNVLLVDQT
jgi:hypothetical protein